MVIAWLRAFTRSTSKVCVFVEYDMCVFGYVCLSIVVIAMMMHNALLPALYSGIPLHRHHAMNSAAVLLYAFTSG